MRRFADKRFGETVLAEEAYTVAFGKLIDPDWQNARLQRFQGNCSPQGFVFSVYRSLLEDYSRSKFGRPRPPAWVQRLGPLWVKVFTLLCLERLEPEAILSRLQRELTKAIKTLVIEAIAVIHSRVTNCGEKTGEVPHDFSESESSGWAGSSGKFAIEDTLDKKTLHDIFSALCAVFAGASGSVDEAKEINPDFVEAATSFSLSLVPKEKLLLRMVYQDGLSVVAAARMLDEPEYTVRRNIKKAVASLRDQLEQSGISSRVLQDLLG